MEVSTNCYNKMTKNQLMVLCKERYIRGYYARGITKEKIIKLLTDYDNMGDSLTGDYHKMSYDKLLALCRKRKIKNR